MKRISTTAISAYVVLTLLFYSCERPGSPNLNLVNKIETPLATEREYKFLGDKDALIDTTKEDLKSLFTVSDKGLVSLNKHKEINFKEFGDVFPEIKAESTELDVRIGELRLGTFTLGSGNITEVSFEDVMGQNSSGVEEGTPIPDQTNHRITDISYSSNYFKSATVKNGSLVMSVENKLGFDIDRFEVEIFSGSRSLGEINFPDGPGLGYTEQKTGELPVDGERLEDINFTITISWAGKRMKTSNPGPLSITEIGGKNMVASEVEAYMPIQRFSIQGMVQVDDNNREFRFTEPDHYVELETGQLKVDNLINNLDVDIDTLRISFPDIRKPPYTAADSLVVWFQGDTRLAAKSDNVISKNIDLSNIRIYGEGQSINYNIYAVTEDTENSKRGTLRTIHEDDSITADIGLERMSIRKVYGVVMPRDVLINDDVSSNGKDRVDLFHEGEAEVVNIEENKSLFEQINGLEFADPSLSILYNTNLGVETTIYAAIAGVNTDGEVKYLAGKPDSEHYVGADKISNTLLANGQPVSGDQLIKFKLTHSEDGAVISGGNGFDKNKTNVDEFISNLPTEIRFIGLARINEDPVDSTGILTNPIHFSPSVSIGLPLHLSARSSTISDTLDISLKDLPKEGDDHTLTEATFIIEYVNNLPFQIEVNLAMLDGNRKVITTIPHSSDDAKTTFSGAPVNSSTRFAESGSKGEVAIALSESQLAKLHQTRHVVVRISFNTTNQEVVKVRAEDSIALWLQMNVTIESEVN